MIQRLTSLLTGWWSRMRVWFVPRTVQHQRDLSNPPNDLSRAQRLHPVRSSLTDVDQACDQLAVTPPWLIHTEVEVDAEASRLAATLFRRLQEPSVHLLNWDSAASESSAAECEHLAGAKKSLAPLHYRLLGDFCQANYTAIQGQSIQQRIWLSPERNSCVLAWRLEQSNVIEFHSWLVDGTILQTSSLTASPFHPPPGVQEEILEEGCLMALVHGRHRERLDELDPNSILHIGGLQDVQALLQHLRILSISHRRQIRGATDEELRDWLAMVNPRLPGAVRRELDRLLAAEAT